MPFLGKIPSLLQSGFCAKLKHLKAYNTLYIIYSFKDSGISSVGEVVLQALPGAVARSE